VEDKKKIMARFLDALNHDRDVMNIVKLQYYIELKDMVHMTTKMKRQLKKYSSAQKIVDLGSFSSGRLNYMKNEISETKSIMDAKVDPSKANEEVITNFKCKYNA